MCGWEGVISGSRRYSTAPASCQFPCPVRTPACGVCTRPPARSRIAEKDNLDSRQFGLPGTRGTPSLRPLSLGNPAFSWGTVRSRFAVSFQAPGGGLCRIGIGVNPVSRWVSLSRVVSPAPRDGGIKTVLQTEISREIIMDPRPCLQSCPVKGIK